jgi:hypothetical protein
MPIPTRARTFALGGYVTGHGLRGGRASRDLCVGRDRCDPPRSSRHHCGHGHTAGAVIAVTAAGAASRARRARRVGRDQQDPARPLNLKGGPGLIGREARNRGDHLVSVAHLAAA